MRYNHILPRDVSRSKCPEQSEHHWLPTGECRATAGDNVGVGFYCKHCGKREWVFLTLEKYKLYENQLKT